MDAAALMTLAKKFAGKFARQHPSGKRIVDELAQEAAIAMFRKQDSFDGRGELAGFLWMHARVAMQMHLSHLGGSVDRPCGRSVGGGCEPATSVEVDGAAFANAFTVDAPQEDAIAAQQASQTVSDFIDARADRIKTRIPRSTLKQVMTAYASGDTLAEAGAIAGVSRERVRQLAGAMDMGDLC